METLEVTWGKTLRIWWSFFWRATLFSLLAGVAAGFMVGVAAALTGQPDKAELWGAWAGYAVGLPVSIWCFRIVLQKTYKDYAIRLVRPEPSLDGTR